jgi:hypothetical protein
MKLYCKIENEVVTYGPGLLPVDIAMKSDFELLDLGWKVAERIVTDTFDDITEVMLPPEFEILPYKVIVTFTKREKTAEEIAEKRAEIIMRVQAAQTQALAACEALMADQPTWVKKSLQEREAWETYKQELLAMDFINIPDIKTFDLPALKYFSPLPLPPQG